jgi:hypothetical protein
MKLLRDTWLVFGRYFGLFIHNPAWVAIGVLQPVLYLVLFAPLLKPIAAMRFRRAAPTTCSCRDCWSSSECLAQPGLASA